MLTVKLVRLDGSEWIEETTSVAFNTAQQSATGRCSITFFLKDKDRFGQDVYDGHVYVMNENGKTIGSYELGTPPLPDIDKEPKDIKHGGKII